MQMTDSSTIHTCTDVWNAIAAEVSDLKPQLFVDGSFTIYPAMVASKASNAVQAYLVNTGASRTVCDGVKFALRGVVLIGALIAIPEALIRTVANLAVTLFCALSQKDNPLQGDTLMEKIIYPITVPFIVGGAALGYDLE